MNTDSFKSVTSCRLPFARIVVMLLCVFSMFSLSANEETDSLLNVLDMEMNQAKSLNENKERYISSLRKRLDTAENKDARFNICRDLYQEYKNFQFDSAYNYASRMLEIAKQTPENKTNKSLAYIALMECYNSVGLFKEADDMLRVINVKDIPDKNLLEFYNIGFRYYRNLCSFSGDSADMSKRYIDSLEVYNRRRLDNSPADSYDHACSLIVIKELAGAPVGELAKEYASLTKRFKLDDHELAVVNSQAGRAFRADGNKEMAIKYLAQSAIHDIRSCTRETTAAKDLAQMMHSEGQIDRANRYIRHALNDAVEFNSRLRQVEINSVLPIIETTRYGRISARISQLVAVVIVIAGLFVLSLFLFFKLRKRNRSLAESHEEIRHKTEELQKSNDTLQLLNNRLKETSEIKDQYIIQSLIGNTDFVGEVEGKIKKAITKLKARQYDETARILRETGIKDERERMYSSFDSAFLKLFPNFPDEFNALFPPEERMEINEESGLPTEVRIYALMRLGIENAAEIARYLNLSVNTVYVYKTRLKSKSIVPKDDFDSRVMSIPKP